MAGVDYKSSDLISTVATLQNQKWFIMEVSTPFSCAPPLNILWSSYKYFCDLLLDLFVQLLNHFLSISSNIFFVQLFQISLLCSCSSLFCAASSNISNICFEKFFHYVASPNLFLQALLNISCAVPPNIEHKVAHWAPTQLLHTLVSGGG